MFRKDAIFLKPKHGNSSGLDVSVDGKKFVHYPVVEDPATETPMRITAVDVFGDVFAWGTRHGHVGVTHLEHSSKSLLNMDLRRPHCLVRLHDVDGLWEHEEDLAVRAVGLFVAQEGVLLVAATRSRMFKIRWPGSMGADDAAVGANDTQC